MRNTKKNSEKTEAINVITKRFQDRALTHARHLENLKKDLDSQLQGKKIIVNM